MKTPWVDFREVKQAVHFEQVLARYQIDWLKESGDNLRGRCPIHDGEGTRTFHVNTKKQIFYCFSCKAKDNVLDFVAAMEKLSVRDAALKLQEWFMGPSATNEQIQRRQTRDSKAKDAEVPSKSHDVNPPLGFELRVNLAHPYGRERGLTFETLERFGAGLCDRAARSPAGS